MKDLANPPTDMSGGQADGGAELIEPEDTGTDELTKPWDPKLIRITTKTFSIREVFNLITDGDVDLAPDFQRSFVWKDRQQIRLIESVLLGIPLPAFYFNQDVNGSFQVIDGVQRLTTVRQFMSNKLSLDSSHLEYLRDLEHQTYDGLDAPIRRRFAGTQIVAHVIEPQTPDEVKYDIFNRVNTGGSPLTAQEIRHCMSKAPSRSFLKQLVEEPNFDLATNYSFWSQSPEQQPIRDNQRMADREMALRFCAFKNNTISEYEKASSLDGFLLEYTRHIDKLDSSAAELTETAQAFSRAMENCAIILGNAAFRRYPPNANRRGPINRAIFEAQALALADYALSRLMPKKDEIVSAFRSLFEDGSYDSAVRSGTGDPRKVERRINMTRAAVAEIVK